MNNIHYYWSVGLESDEGDSCIGDNGVDGITTFREQHECNTICTKLELQPCGDIGQFNINAELFGTDNEESSVESDGSGSLEEVKIDKEGSMQGKDGSNGGSPSRAQLGLLDTWTHTHDHNVRIGMPWIGWNVIWDYGEICGGNRIWQRG
jgi:hypothetical protein